MIINLANKKKKENRNKNFIKARKIGKKKRKQIITFNGWVVNVVTTVLSKNFMAQ